MTKWEQIKADPAKHAEVLRRKKARYEKMRAELNRNPEALEEYRYISAIKAAEYRKRVKEQKANGQEESC